MELNKISEQIFRFSDRSS